MKIYRNFNIEKKFRHSAIAIGNFDGFHIGHQRVINRAKKISKMKRIKFGLITFEPLPVMFFNKNLKNYRLDNLDQKILSLKKYGVDFLIIKKFNKKFSNISASNFIEKILYNKLKCKLIFVSKNFKFGKNRIGNISLLRDKEKKFFYKTIIINPLRRKTKIISSSLIRNMISKGKINHVNYLLNRYWTIEGFVKRGEKKGRIIGFPTCNLCLKDYMIPQLGVYSAKIIIDKKTQRKGIVNIGYRPTFEKKKLILEAHIFGLKKNLYDKKIKIMLIKFIRHEKKFRNILELKKQIAKDIKIVKQI